MKNKFSPREIPALSMPVTSSNRRNANNNPAVNLGSCTPFQLFESTGMSHSGSVCVIGNSARGIGVAKALIRRNNKPFLFLGVRSDENSVFSSLEPEWTLNSNEQYIENGNGAIFFSRPSIAYTDICMNFDEWATTHFIIMHVGNGLQVGAELLNLFASTGECLIFCDGVPQSIRNDKYRTITPLDFLKQMQHLLIFSAGSEAGDLVQLLPKYQYERVTNTQGVNTFKSRSFFHPFHVHRGQGYNVSQSRTMEFQKSVFEQDDLQRIFNSGYLLIYNARQNTVYTAQLT